MNRRHALRAALAGLPAAASLPLIAADRPLVAQTRLIDSFVASGRDLQPGSMGRAGPDFQPQRDGGPVWLMFDIVARREDDGRGELVLDSPLLHVPVRADQALVLVKDSQMVTPRAEHWRRDADGRLTAPSGHSLPDDVQATLGAALAAGRARRLVVIHRIDLTRPEPTQPRVAVARHSGLQPLLVEVQVGQGPVPREQQAFADAVNGPWVKRHLNEVALIGSGVLLGALALWRLRR